ncbi:MAG: hypothetical protein ACKVU0_07945 [Saprospiraceae bacterium]
MNHYKISPIFAILFLITLFYQCQNDYSVIDARPKGGPPKLASLEVISLGSSSVLDKYLETPEYDSFLLVHKFKSVEYHRLITDGKEEFFGIRMEKTDLTSGNKEYYFAIYPDAKKTLYKTLLFEEDNSNSVTLMSVYETKNLTQIANLEISQSSKSDNSIALDRSCYSDNPGNFGGCMYCVGVSIIPEIDISLGCVFFTAACVATATAHCLGYAPY